jgi:chemotaxis protein CheD
VSMAASTGAARERTMHVVQGEYRVISDARVVLTTILGSCVSTCIWDEVAGVGGMNHFLLPGNEGGSSDHVKYGVNAMELLINGLLKQGAARALAGKTLRRRACCSESRRHRRQECRVRHSIPGA